MDSLTWGLHKEVEVDNRSRGQKMRDTAVQNNAAKRFTDKKAFTAAWIKKQQGIQYDMDNEQVYAGLCIHS